jgi:hypothetical protein
MQSVGDEVRDDPYHFGGCTLGSCRGLGALYRQPNVSRPRLRLEAQSASLGQTSHLDRIHFHVHLHFSDPDQAEEFWVDRDDSLTEVGSVTGLGSGIEGIAAN